MSRRRPRVLLLSDSVVLLAGLAAALRHEGFTVARGVSHLNGLHDAGQDPQVGAIVIAATNGVTSEIAPALEKRRSGMTALVLLPDVGLAIHADALADAGVLCLPLTARPEEIARALSRAHAQRAVVREPVARGAGGRLTPREQEALDAAASGATNREIAERLGISPETVKDRLRRTYRKLSVSNRTEAVAAYLESVSGS